MNTVHKTHKLYSILLDLLDMPSDVILLIISYWDMTIIHLEELNNEQLMIFFGQLIEFVYCTTEIQYIVTKKGKTRNIRDTLLRNSPIYNKMESNMNYYFAFNPILYKYDSIHDYDSINDIEDPESHIMIELINLLKYDKYGLKDITFTCKYAIKLVNKAGINDDERGHQNDISGVRLKFVSRYILLPNFTLLDFVFACYRIKSCKFNTWYELYCGVGEIKKSKNTLKVYVNFDHGS
jgi:hypothetical protein